MTIRKIKVIDNSYKSVHSYKHINSILELAVQYPNLSPFIRVQTSNIEYWYDVLREFHDRDKIRGPLFEYRGVEWVAYDLLNNVDDILEKWQSIKVKKGQYLNIDSLYQTFDLFSLWKLIILASEYVEFIEINKIMSKYELKILDYAIEQKELDLLKWDVKLNTAHDPKGNTLKCKEAIFIFQKSGVHTKMLSEWTISFDKLSFSYLGENEFYCVSNVIGISGKISCKKESKLDLSSLTKFDYLKLIHKSKSNWIIIMTSEDLKEITFNGNEIDQSCISKLKNRINIKLNLK